MARVRKTAPTLDSVFFSTPAQKVMRLLLTEPTSSFTPRAIASKLKGVRGIGGVEGLDAILHQLEELKLVDFVDSRRAVRLHDDHAIAAMLKSFAAVCDLESLRVILEPLCARGVLFGSRASGRARSDSDYDLFVVTEYPDKARDIAARHPLGRAVEVVAWTPDQFERIGTDDAGLQTKLQAGIPLWGPAW